MTSERNRQAVLLMSAADPETAYRHLAELSRRGDIARGMIIAELDDGHIHVIGQRARSTDMAHLLLAAVEALKRAEESDPEAAHNQPPAAPPRVEPEVQQALGGVEPGTMALLWAGFEAAIYADNPGVDWQRNANHKRIFYGGGLAVMHLMTANSEHPATADKTQIEALADELIAFRDAVIAGRA